MLKQRKFLMTAFVVALGLLTVPANAQIQNDGRVPDMPDMPIVTEEEAGQGWGNTGQAVSETTDATGDLVEGAVVEIRHALIDDEATMLGTHVINYNPEQTAKNIIGSSVHSSDGNVVGNIRDILVDENGKAQYFVLNEGSVLGLGGRRVAFEYENMAAKIESGAVVAPVTEEMAARKRDYDPNIHQGHSLRKMLDGKIVGAEGQTMASIDNIVLENGSATYIVVGFDKLLGLLGGEKAVLSYGTGTFVTRDNEINVVLNISQTVNFETFQNAATN